MGGLSGNRSDSKSQSNPGTLSPAQAVLFSLFGSDVGTMGGDYSPVGFGGQRGNGTPTHNPGVFNPGMFSALPGLLSNMPASGAENFLTSPDFQGAALSGLGAAEGLYGAGDQAFQQALAGPEQAIALARRGFTQETMPAILERAPGFSSSDLQRELTRGGTDLDTNIGALREQYRMEALGALPGYAQARRGNLPQGAGDILGLGTLGREFQRDVSPAGDAFRVLEMLQSLTGPSLTSSSTSKSKSAGGSI